MLFTDRSLWTMVHGVVLGGAALMAIAAALFAMSILRTANGSDATTERQSRSLGWLTVLISAMLWLTTLMGTYIVFPPYRATPPEGVTDLSRYPRALLLSNPDTAWLHAFAMESKEHMPWIAAMLATAVAFVSLRHRMVLLSDARLRRMSFILVAICLVLVSFVGLMGIFVDKVAPLE
jgi:hypothetical protein